MKVYLFGIAISLAFAQVASAKDLCEYGLDDARIEAVRAEIRTEADVHKKELGAKIAELYKKMYASQSDSLAREIGSEIRAMELDKKNFEDDTNKQMKFLNVAAKNNCVTTEYFEELARRFKSMRDNSNKAHKAFESDGIFARAFDDELEATVGNNVYFIRAEDATSALIGKIEKHEFRWKNWKKPILKIPSEPTDELGAWFSTSTAE